MLAELVKLRGLRTQNFKTVTTRIDRFVDAIESVDDEYGPFVRYGAPLRKFSASMADELKTAHTSINTHDAAGPLGRLAPLLPDNFGEREITLFLAAAGVTSTAHYDNSANMHMLLSGRKRFRLRKPLLALDTLVTWPDTHPNARQLQTPVAPDDVTFTTVELEAGDGLFVPAGWIHEVTALERSIALSLLAPNFEYGDFERFGTEDRLQMIPFLARLRGTFDPVRLSKVFKVFVVSLLARLEMPELMRTLLSMYSAETRAEFGMPPAATWPFGCHAADAIDAAIVREGAEVVAMRFLKYHATLRPRYVTVYLENILGVMASFLDLPTKEATLQELQHDHIERQLQHHDDHNDPRSNHGPVDETRAEAAAVGATADNGGMPPTERKASEETVRCASLESAERLGECAGGAHGTEEEPLPSLKQLAAPLLGIMGSALQRTASAGATAATALKRRGSAAAAAASAAAGAGHGAAAVAAAVAFAQAPGSPAPPPPPPAGIGGGSVAQLAAAEVEAAENAFRAASEVWTATLGQQREALPSSAARLVNQVLGDARARVESVSQQLRAELEHAGSRGRAFWPAEPVSTSDEATAPGSAKTATMLTKSAVDACAALGEARDARVLEVEATLRACEKRLDALRSTRHEASASLGGNTILPKVSSDTDEPSSAEVVAADKALKDLDSSAAFELEQALWRGGLRGAALQARVASELNDLREQWREHRAKAEHAAVEEARQREAQKKRLAAYVRRSMLDAATHSLSRLLDVATATAGDLTAVALRALHQRTIAMHRGLGTPADDGALTRDAATSSLVQHLVSGGEALMVQLHAELATLVEAVAAAATQVEAWVRAEEELRIVARQADVQSRGAVGVSERALEARCAVFDGDVLQLRYRALEGFGRGLTLMLEFGEALLVGELLRVAPSWGTQQTSAEAGSASPHTPQTLQLQHSRVPAFDPAESSAEAGTPLTRGAASTAFAEVWLNSRGSLLSPGSLPTANMSVTPLTAVDDGRLSVGTIPVLSSPPSCLASTTHTAEPVGAPPAAAPAEEELVARQLLWEEESDAAAAATAAEETGEEVAIAIIAEREQGEMAVEEMLAFLDEAAQLVGLPKPSEQIQEQTRLESRPAQVEDV
eukprot:jgi/Chrpa1/10767/Chrysochromulina_OHIO_Genome00021842-RA